MISLVENTLVQGGKIECIEKWEVWFMTPFGVSPDYKEAEARLKEIDIPVSVIRPVPVAISKSMYEVQP